VTLCLKLKRMPEHRRIRCHYPSDGALWFTEAVGNKIGPITTSGTITGHTLPIITSSHGEHVLAKSLLATSYIIGRKLDVRRRDLEG
jgi:hypothetical protein